ncbi:MAG: LCP family protein, partial [Anaerolineae bacterium]|nr:LCP family protein [Anaerolineae bacterium]
EATPVPTVAPTPVPTAPPPASRPTPVPAPDGATTVLVLGTGGEGSELVSIRLADVVEASRSVDVKSLSPSLTVVVGDGEKELRAVYQEMLSEAGGDESAAAAAMAGVLADNFGVTVDERVTFRESVIASMIDSLGGIDVTVTTAFGDMPAGAQHLDGAAAWRYATASSGGAPVSERRIQALGALRKRVFSLGTLLKIPQLAGEFIGSGAVRTDMSVAEVLGLVMAMKDVPASRVTFR